MRQATQASNRPKNGATRIIIGSLEQHLRRVRTRRVYFAEDSVAPPVLAYVTHFPRLYVPLLGSQAMQVAQNGRSCTIQTKPGDAVFVPDNAWDKPEWSNSIQVLTFLFGAKQIGISLVEHKGGSDAPVSVVKTNIHGAHDGLIHNLLSALTTFAADRSTGPLPHLLTESLLHSCLRLLRSTPSHHSRKATRTYESICLFIQENFQHPLSRESVAEHFGLAPNHISRLFRQEGSMRFNDYLNLVRINRAKFMLRNYNMTLKEVSAKCGYGEVAYFCRLFKRINKETPTDYRASRQAGDPVDRSEIAHSSNRLTESALTA